MKCCMPFIILHPRPILLFTVLVLHFPSLADPDNTCVSSRSVSVANCQKARPAQSCPLFLYEIIHPSVGQHSGSCHLFSVSFWPWWPSSLAWLTVLTLRCGLCSRLPPSTMSSQLELQFGKGPLRRRRNMPNSTILYCRAWHPLCMSCGDEPGLSQLPWQESGVG